MTPMPSAIWMPWIVPWAIVWSPLSAPAGGAALERCTSGTARASRPRPAKGRAARLCHVLLVGAAQQGRPERLVQFLVAQAGGADLHAQPVGRQHRRAAARPPIALVRLGAGCVGH